jgi:hypothetical protein
LRNTWPPFRNEFDLEQYFSDFLAVATEPDGIERPDGSFIWVEVYVAKRAKDKVVEEFESFERHLKSIPVLQEAGIV